MQTSLIELGNILKRRTVWLNHVKLYKMGPAIMESGRQKFDIAWGDVVTFVKHGTNSIDRYDTL